MSASARRMMQELAQHLEKYGLRIVSWEPSKRHRKVWVTDGNKQVMIVAAVSPSDHRGFRNLASNARNAIREAR